MAKQILSKKKKAAEKKPSISHSSLTCTEAKDSELVSETLAECIRAGDVDSFRSVLASYITNCNKLRFSQKTGLGRQTLYDILDPTKSFNPALATVAAIMRGIAE